MHLSSTAEVHGKADLCRRGLLALAPLAAFSMLTRSARASVPIIYLAPLGDALADSDAEFVERSLKAFYAVEVRRLPRAELPRNAYYAKRQRYRAERLLAFLASRLPADGLRILGLTSVDISTTKPPHADWGILGLATLDGRACVVSSFRCKRLARSAGHARIRYGKVCVHEIGHTFGLPHCPTDRCLMQDGRGSVLTTDREYDLCAALCRPRLLRAGYALSDSRDVPWPVPEQTAPR
jgi:archaemetzincin